MQFNFLQSPSISYESSLTSRISVNEKFTLAMFSRSEIFSGAHNILCRLRAKKMRISFCFATHPTMSFTKYIEIYNVGLIFNLFEKCNVWKRAKYLEQIYTEFPIKVIVSNEWRRLHIFAAAIQSPLLLHRLRASATHFFKRHKKQQQQNHSFIHSINDCFIYIHFISNPFNTNEF